MSITTPDDRISTYNPVVATTTFAALFPVFDNSDLTVFVDDVERTDFTVSATYINSISNDATVVFSPGIVGEVKVIGTRDPRRISRFLDGAPLPTRDQNTALDVVMASLQELARDVRRAVKVGFGAIGFNVDTTGIADNSVLMYRDDKIVIGPTAGDVANAQTNAASATDSAIKAQKWADNPLNQEVIAGRFSAMHWALKALEWASAGVAGVSSFNGRTGAVTPQAGDYPNKQDAIHSAAVKANLSLNDEFGLADSGDSWNAKKQTLAKLQEAFGVPTLTDNVTDLQSRAITLEQQGVRFKSANQTYTLGAQGAVAHGLSEAPTKLSAEFVCLVASSGWAVGDRFEMASGTQPWPGQGSYGILLWADAINIYWQMGLNGVVLLNKGVGNTVAAPSVNWAFRVKAAR